MEMHLVQLFLPLTDNTGKPLPKELHSRVRSELVQRFGGLTAYTRSPAKGIWLDDSDAPVQDENIVYEVVVDELDRGWWQAYVRALESQFRQEHLHVRALAMELL